MLTGERFDAARAMRMGLVHQVAASADDLERIAADDNADVRALSGWRRELFGEHALALKRGEVALTTKGNRTQIIELHPDT